MGCSDKDKQHATPGGVPGKPGSKRPVPAAARRALDEAEARRKARERQSEISQDEVDGRDGPDPVRYGDWEKRGIVSDF